MASDFKIGTTSGGVTSLDALSPALPDPQQQFSEYRRKERLDNLTVKGRGPQTIQWTFPLIETAQLAVLEGFQATDPIYIRSPKRNDTWGLFEVHMNWVDPREDGDHMNGFRGWRGNLTIEFIVVSEVT